MTTPSLLLVEQDLAALGFLADLVAQAGYEVSTAGTGKEGLIEAWRRRPDVLVVSGDLTDLPSQEMVRKLRADARTAHAKIVVLASNAHPTEVLAFNQAGADEYIVKLPGAHVELLERLRQLKPAAPAPAAEPEPPPKGKLVTFLGTKGGIGTSSLCINIADLLGDAIYPRRVAVVDLVLPIGSLSDIVGVETPGRNIVAATQLDPREIDPEHLTPMLTQPAGWQPYLLPGAPDPQSAQVLRVDHLETVITALRREYDVVFVDCGRALSRVTLPLIRTSARVMLVTSADLATVAMTKRVLLFLDTQEVRRNHVALILNRAVGLEGLSRPELEREVGMPVRILVPHLSGQFATANNQHVPVKKRLSSDTVLFSLQDLVFSVTEILEAAPEQPVPAG